MAHRIIAPLSTPAVCVDCAHNRAATARPAANGSRSAICQDCAPPLWHYTVDGQVATYRGATLTVWFDAEIIFSPNGDHYGPPQYAWSLTRHGLHSPLVHGRAVRCDDAKEQALNAARRFID